MKMRCVLALLALLAANCLKSVKSLPFPHVDPPWHFITGKHLMSTSEMDQNLEFPPVSESSSPDVASVTPASLAGDHSEHRLPDTSETDFLGGGKDTHNPGITDTIKGEAEAENKPRAIVDIRQEGMRGEVSYIIHPDNQPPPTYQPLQYLPPAGRPVAQWRPDIFMKICCSSPEPESSPAPSQEINNSGDAEVIFPDSQKGEATNSSQVMLGEEEEYRDYKDTPMEATIEDNTTTAVPEEDEDAPSILRSSDKALEDIFAAANSTDMQPEVASNHTPRYEDASSSPYQEVANFLRDIASSEGFQSGFLGDLIKNFGSLDQNAMKLIYSLLIRPLEEGHASQKKEDRVGLVEDISPERPNVITRFPKNTMALSRDRLPLRDQTATSFQPFHTSLLQNQPSHTPAFPIQPSLPVHPPPLFPLSDEVWRPGRTYNRPTAVNRHGDEGVDVITAPPFKTFEVVLGSSLNHNDKKLSGGSAPSAQVTPANAPPLPFDKLTLGLEMPPPEALEALPPGSILIPPSHIIGRPKLPKILPQRSGTPTLEMPLTDFLPNLPFFNKPSRFQPPAKPKVQDIPPRLPGFLTSLLSGTSPPRAVRPPSPMMQPPRRVDARLSFPNSRQPTGPPPIVTKMTPPTVPTVSTSVRPLHHSEISSGSIPMPPFLSVPPHPHPHLHLLSDKPWSPLQPEIINKQEHHKYSGHKPLNLGDFDVYEKSDSDGNVRKGHVTQDSVANRNEDYQIEAKQEDSDEDYRHLPHPAYYSEVSSEYTDSYYDDLDYDDYYLDKGSEAVGQQLPSDDPSLGERPFVHEATATFLAAEETYPSSPVVMTTAVAPPLHDKLRNTDQFVIDHHTQQDEYIAVDAPFVHYPNLDDLLGVVKPNISITTQSKQENNNIQSFLQNHQPAAIPVEDDGDIVNLAPKRNSANLTRHPLFAAKDITTLGEISTGHDQGAQSKPSGDSFSITESEHSQHDTSISHLWKNLQLIPLTPNLFVTTEQENSDFVNITSLFDASIPLAPDTTLDLVPDLSSDVDKISIDKSGVHVTVTEEVLEDPEKADAKFMAYVLIGACCGLALLSITGVIVIVRFKKTCGSRQIKTRTRLTEQDSVENISRHVNQLPPGEESGHKLGSWFTGRNEHIGSGKLRGNMALPTVFDHKREKKGHSSSTRDLLSISSQSSCSNSPHQDRRGDEASSKAEEDEPRSWLHREYCASMDDITQASGQDLSYHSQHYPPSQASPHIVHTRHHSTNHHLYHLESTQVNSPPAVRERRYTEKSRDADRPPHSPTHQGPLYTSSMDSEELEERLTSHTREYPTDSELDDGTTHYDGESREPSHYFSDSRELDNIVSRRVNPPSMTSQELGENISRDLKQYQSRRGSRMQHPLRSEELKDQRDTPGQELSSQDLESEESRELRRSQSQVSFSRDNVQNEVFLEFDSMLRQQGQYLTSELPATSTLGRTSLLTSDTHLSASRANTPDSIDLPEDFPQDSCRERESEHQISSPPTTPPRFSPPPAPPRPPKPGHLSQSSTPSPQTGRGRPPSPGQSPPSPPTSIQRPVYWTSEEERLI